MVTSSRRPPIAANGFPRRIAAAIVALIAVSALLIPAPPSAANTPRRMIAPGTAYFMIQRDGPLRIHVIELDPRERYIALACAPVGSVPGRMKVSEIATVNSSDSRYAVAAVNGDYFVIGGTTDGELLGLNVTGGRLISAGGGRSALVVLEDGRARVATLALDAWLERPDGKRVSISAVNQPRGRNDVVLYTPAFGASTKTSARGREVVISGLKDPVQLGQVCEGKVTASTQAMGDLELGPHQVIVSASGDAGQRLAGLQVGDAVKLRADLTPQLEGRIVEAIGGGPLLLRNGRLSVAWAEESFTAKHALPRHPRTAAGVKPDGRVVLVTVDGRQSSSVGMTLHGLAYLMADLGCRDAVNLDGGGSTTMWVRGQVVNSPSEGRERAVGNALLVISAAPHGPPTQLRLTPESISALPGYRVTIKVEAAQDAYYNPVTLDTTGVGWAFEGPIGTISARGEFTAGEAAETVEGAVKVYVAGVVGRVPVTVHARPAELRITPQTVTTAPGASVRFNVTALDKEGDPISFDPALVKWEADASAGNIGDGGVLAVGPGPTGIVTATLAGAQASARVVCASTTVAVEGFEEAGTCSASAYPREVAAASERVTDPVQEGHYAAKLSYDFSTTTQSRAAYLDLKRDVGQAVALRAWVYGDGLGHWLRARISDSRGREFNLDFGRVDWSEWREVTASVPTEAQGPIRWESIYISEFRADRQDSGALVFDGLRAEVAAAK